MFVLAIALATVIAFVLTYVYYTVLPPSADSSVAASSDQLAPWQIAAELLRSGVVATLVAGLMTVAGWAGIGSGAALGLALWALPAVLLAGSVMWEDVPAKTAALHAGDWLIKLVVMGFIVGWLA